MEEKKKNKPLYSLCIKCKKVSRSYGKPGGRKTHCGTCKEDGMVLISTRKCQDCKTKQPTFGSADSTRPTHCGDCRKEGMIDIFHPRCEKCGDRARYGTEWNKPIRCITCRVDPMENVVTPRCIKCKKVQCCYGKKGTTKATHCVTCKDPDMVDVKSAMCISCKDVCATYGAQRKKKATHCVTCKEDGMIPVNKPKCSGCDNVRPSYGFVGTRATHCKTCKTQDMVDLIHLKCKTPLCETRVDQTFYSGFCTRCAVHNGISVKRNYKTKENTVIDHLKEELPDLDWKLDKTIDGGCSRRRGDMHLDMGYLYLIIEVDENQHKGYSEICDKSRYHDIALDIYSTSGERPIVFLRFNPDCYKDHKNKKISTHWSLLKSGMWSISKSKFIDFLDRLDVLKDRINHYMDQRNIPSNPLTVETMFYDGHDPSNPVIPLNLVDRI